MTHSALPERTVTELLVAWRAGDAAALELLIPRVYDELRRIARSHLKAERAGQTLSATDLVHEAFLRLVDVDVAWNDRAHFLAVGARVMRRILVDRSRAKTRQKRPDPAHRVPLDAAQPADMTPSQELLELDRAIGDLAHVDERKAQVVELIFFGGLSYDEVAAALEISRATAHRDLSLAKAWLHDRIETSAAPAS